MGSLTHLVILIMVKFIWWILDDYKSIIKLIIYFVDGQASERHKDTKPI